MDICSSSRLIRSRYVECVSLLHPETTAGTRVDWASTNCRDVNSHEARRDDVAFLSSVETPSEVCVSLACVARPRDAAVSGVGGRLLVFVPYDTPRDEILVEMPILAFKEARDPTRGRGLQLMVLNEYSLLCSRTKDGLPPRKGLFITFRTRKTQQLFREALDRLIRNHDNDSPLDVQFAPSKCVNRMVQAGGEEKRAGTPMSGAAMPRGPAQAKLQRKEWQREEEERGGKESKEGRRAMSLINNLLRDRDRRREAYMVSIGEQPRHQSYLPGVATTPPSSFLELQGNNIEFGDLTQQHQKLNPTAWMVPAGAAKYQMVSRCQAVKPSSGVMKHPRVPYNTDVALPQCDVSTLKAREELFHAIRAAMETVDKMNEAQGRVGVSLLESSRAFVRQHQEDLWLLEREGRKLHPSASLLNSKHIDTPSPSATTSLQQQEQLLQGPSVSEASREPIRPCTPALASKAFDSIIPTEDPHLTLLETTSTVQNIVTAAPLMASEPVSPSRRSVGPDVSPQGSHVSKIQEELQVARETESRILSTFYKAAPKLVANKRVFGTIPKTSAYLQPSPITPIVDRVERGGDGSGGATSFITVGSATPTSVPSATNNEGVSGVTSAEPVLQEIKEEEETPCCGKGWKTVHDPASGKCYFVHTVTKRTTWDIADTLEPNPNERENEKKQGHEDNDNVKKTPRCGAGWRAVVDPSTGRTYYVHKITKRSTWKVGDTFEEKDSNSTPDHQATDQQKPAKTSSSIWGERQDPSTGKVYYYNKMTKLTTWKRSETDLDTA